MKLAKQKVRKLAAVAWLAFAGAALAGDRPPEEPGKPNILVILSDDQGYADAGFQGSRDIPTPHLDRLAREGVICTDGYVTHAYCGPSRAGLMTGRYQMRFGFERNPALSYCDVREGVPLTETLLPEFLQKAGYATGFIGKWHLGCAPALRPEKRGFQETFGFLGGSHHFMNWSVDASQILNTPILRNGKPVDVAEHLTIAFGNEAGAFVRRHQAEPWFLYLAFNAPHTPHEPTPERLARFAHIEDKTRRAYVAQVSLMDDAIGETLAALRETGQAARTLVFFFSDNGGPVSLGPDNSPLRGLKGTVFEGGVRVPFLVSWPGRLPVGATYGQTVSSLDVFATALACAGVPMPADKPYDGVNLVPYLSGKKAGNPHETLFWRQTEWGLWGARHGSMKLVRRMNDISLKDFRWQLQPLDGTKNELFDLSNDMRESRNIAERQPEALRDMLERLQAWEKQAAPLAFGGE